MSNPSRWPQFPEGDLAQHGYWEAILPDPERPGKYRLAQLVTERRLKLLPGFVDVDGNPIEEPPPNTKPSEGNPGHPRSDHSGPSRPVRFWYFQRGNEQSLHKAVLAAADHGPADRINILIPRASCKDPEFVDSIWLVEGSAYVPEPLSETPKPVEQPKP